MKHLYSLSLLLLAFLLPATTLAYDFEVDGIYYNLNGNEATVTYSGSDYYQYSDRYSGDVNIPSTVTYGGTTYSVTSIGEGAFYSCEGVTTVVIPNSVASIGNYAFSSCTGLTSVIIPNSVTSIGKSAFKNCSGLTNIDIPNYVTTIGEDAFYNTAWYNNQPDGLVYAGLVAYEYKGSMPSGTSIIIKEGTLSVSSRAFSYYSSLTSVTIPNSVTSIGYEAFYNCNCLTSINIPNSVTTIGNDAFSGTAWYKNQPDGVVYAGLVAYKYKGTMPNGTSITLRDGTLGIAGSAFLGCTGLTSINIPNSVTSIGKSAFYGCSGLTSIVIPNSVTSISDYAFSRCSGLTSIDIPNSVTTIGSSAFSNCSGLTGMLTIPNSVTSISGDAFGKCSGLTGLELGSSVTEIGSNAFQHCIGLTDVTIPNSVTSIGSFAFQFCDGIKSLHFGNSVKYMGDRCFQYCTGLTDIIIPNSVITIDAAFYQCTGLKSVRLGNSIQTIGNSSFFNCNVLKDITIPNSVEQIGRNAFGYCANLTSVTIPDSVISIGSFAFGSCRRLNNVRIGKSVKLIEERAFNTEYNNYIDLTICGSIDSVGTDAFNRVKTIYIKSEVTKIPNLRISPNTIYCYAAVPPTCLERTFSSYGSVLHVPSTSLASYFTANYWSNFINIIGDAIEPTSIDLNYSFLEISYGEQKQIIATVLPNGAYPNSITWTSTDPSIAFVSNGIISAIAEGECDIIASCFNIQAVCHVIVKNDVQTIISLDKHELRIKPNEIATLTATSSSDFLPDFVVSSSDPTVAAARVVNNIIQVVGVKYGTAIITVGSADGLAQTDSCFVTVYSDTIKGDANGDGEVNIADINVIVNIILGGRADPATMDRADVNDDGEVNIADINAIIDIILR